MKDIQKYTVKEIEAKAWGLLRNLYGSIISIPVDVEYLAEKHPHIIDLDLIKGLKSKYGIVGCITRIKEDKYIISIDSDIADFSPYMYRFTVAEEFSHLILHRRILTGIDTIEKTLKLLSDSRYNDMDRNARRFAAALLMPNKLVIDDSETLYNEIVLRDGFKENNLILAEMIMTLRKKYDVSRETMFYRVNEWPLQIIKRVEFSVKIKSKELLVC